MYHRTISMFLPSNLPSVTSLTKVSSFSGAGWHCTIAWKNQAYGRSFDISLAIIHGRRRLWGWFKRNTILAYTFFGPKFGLFTSFFRGWAAENNRGSCSNIWMWLYNLEQSRLQSSTRRTFSRRFFYISNWESTGLFEVLSTLDTTYCVSFRLLCSAMAVFCFGNAFFCTISTEIKKLRRRSTMFLFIVNPFS